MLWFGLTCAKAEGVRQFTLNADDVIVFTGGANCVTLQEDGTLETLLIASRPNLRLRFRNLGWEGDTVYAQPRELNFGPWSHQLKKIGASVIFAQFGQMESMDGPDSLPRFLAAYGALLEEFSRQTSRLVLVSPPPFEKLPPPLPDPSERNGDLARFVEAIRQLAAQRGLQFVDPFNPLRRTPPPLTDDGVHLNPRGHWFAAREISRQLGITEAATRVTRDATSGSLRPSDAEQLRQLVRVKNQLWFNYWRPMNWAFLHGDRTEQPSSRDHRDPKVRWFPAELEKFLPLIEAREREIDALASRR